MLFNVLRPLIPSSPFVAKALQDIMMYSTNRGDIEFLEGKMEISTYIDIVRSRTIQECVQTSLTQFFKPESII